MIWKNIREIEKSYTSVFKVNTFVYFEFLFRQHSIRFNCRIIESQLIISNEKIENEDRICKTKS